MLLEHFDHDTFLKFSAALIALLNPFYGIPVFLGMTDGYTQAHRRKTANVIALTVFVAATIATLIGEEILGFFGIGVSAFQIAGGLIILGIAFAMIKDEKPATGDVKAEASGRQHKDNIAVVPLAIPLTIGPGAFVTIILFAHTLDDVSEIFTMLPVVLGVSLTIWVGLWFADPIARALGDTVISVITRIMALVLAAVAVEMVINGGLQVISSSFPNMPKATSPGS